MIRTAAEKADFIASVLDWVRDGGSVLSWCAAEPGRPPQSTIRLWLSETPELAAEYARAREDRGHVYAEKVARVCDDVAAGRLDPNAARVIIDGHKWTAARMAPKSYGDRVQAEVSGPSGGPIEIVLPVSLMLGDRKPQE